MADAPSTLSLSGNANSYPVASVYVKRWLTDSQGLYVGAEMIVVVRGPDTTTTPVVTDPVITPPAEAS